ncbi:hypothetical protein OAM04_03120 [bacterium]|nr:hypothetical protein [bacterium]
MATDDATQAQQLGGRNWMISGSRIWTIARGTLTQLIRMKTFYFLIAIAFLLVIVGNLNLQASAASQLSMIKKVSFGTMDLFAWLFAIVATAVLIPRDIEDRTLYTILSKPVLRIEYLLGKLVGVLLVIAIALIGMFIVFSLIIHARTVAFAGAELEYLKGAGKPAADIQLEVNAITSQGLRPALGIAVLAIFLKSAVVASVTIFLSTFASSSLFSIIIGMILYLVGNAREMAMSFWEYESDGSMAVALISKVFKILIPDYQLFSFAEGIVLGEKILPHLVWSMAGMSIFYAGFFIALALLVFYDKEF